LNFDKTHSIQLNNASKCTSVMGIEYEDEQISTANETKFNILITIFPGKQTLKVLRIN